MKKLKIAVYCFGMLIFQKAHSDSNVTLYGILDTGILYVHNVTGQSNRIGLSSGNYLGDRWGLSGSEGLGGGLSAIFRLENGFNIDSGALSQGSRLFGRQAYVGLSKDDVGTLTLGRQYDPTVDLIEPIQGNWFMEYFSTPGDIDNTQNSARFNNAIKYTSRNLGGFVAEVLYSFGGVAGSVGSGQAYSAAISYNSGPFGIAAGYFYLSNGNQTISNRGTSSVDSLFATSVNSAYASASAIASARIGAKYDFGVVQTGGYFSQTSYKSDSQSKFVGTEDYRNYNVYALWRNTPRLLTEFGYNYLQASGPSNSHYHQFTLALDYILSRRTDVYLSAGYTRASGRNGIGDAQSVIGPSDIDAGSKTQALVMAGIKQQF